MDSANTNKSLAPAGATSTPAKALTRRRLLQAGAATSAAIAGASFAPRYRARAAQEKTTLKLITLSTWEPQWNATIEAFTRKNPDIAVEYEVYPFRQLFEIIEVRMQGKSKDADLLCVDVPLVASYSIRGYLSPLDEYFANGLDNIWVDSSLEAGRYDGQFMAAPLNTSTQFTYVNLDLFEAAGLTPPSAFTANTLPTVDEIVAGRMTWEQVVEAAQAMTADSNGDGQNDVWGFTFDQVSRPYQILALPESLNQPSLSEDGLSTQGFLDSEKWIQAATFYRDTFNTWNISPKGVTPEQTPDLFATSKAAIFVGGEWNIPRFVEAGVNFGIAAHPFFADNRVATPTGSWHLGIPAFSEKKEAAGKFVQFVTADPEGTQIWFDKHAQFPATLALLDAVDQDEAYGAFPKIGYRLGASEARNTAVPRPKTPGYLEFEDILATTLEDIRNGSEPAQALPDAVRRIDRGLAKYR